ncbi:MAG: glutamine--fructose-6-phosphate transaminase (isomerizing) [Pseudomonadota bacterium]
MCGIIGILGQMEAAPRLMDALRRLEYRGYDSAGITVLQNGIASRRRAVGKLRALREVVSADPPHGSAGIGHTRWATHGAPTEGNAHPHAAGPVHVVHNGIIENHATLRRGLIAEGVSFDTETDTEIVARLVALRMAAGDDPVAAVAATLPRLEGAYALAFLFDGHPDLMIGAVNGSPLALGWGDGEMFLGSSAEALAPMTDRVSFLEDGDVVVMTREGATVTGRDGKPVERSVAQVSLDQTLAERGPYRHFMLKEIHEQPAVLSRLVEHMLSPGRDRLPLADGSPDWARVSRLMLIGCGTAALAGRLAKYWFESLAGLPCEADIASEFRYRAPPLNGDEAAIFISQSGETADTLAAMRFVKDQIAHRAVVLNVPTSAMSREADQVLPILAGPEIGVASTKAFTAMLVRLAGAAVAAAVARGRMDGAAETNAARALAALPAQIGEALATENTIKALSQDLAAVSDVLYLGRGAMFPVALEGALKLKEISYIHAEGYASGELKHGPIALIDETMPVVVVAARDANFAKSVSNMQEVMARGGRVILISDAAGIAEAGDKAVATIEMPDVPDWLAPIVYTVPVQLLAYYTALAKGTDVDQPRNLAKSVTVE